VIADWMDVMGLESAIFLGNSLGCQVIVQLALRHPGRVRCGILVGPTFDASARDTLQQAWRLFLDTLREPLALNWINFSDYISAGPLRVWRTFQNGLHQPETANLAQVDVPVLVVRGSIDPIVPQEWAERVANLLPHGRLVVIPEAPHAVNFSHPVELVQAVCDFLQDIGEWQPG
jgi:pimeloyl-ACP methyl ester carboxylesterase